MTYQPSQHHTRPGSAFDALGGPVAATHHSTHPKRIALNKEAEKLLDKNDEFLKMTIELPCKVDNHFVENEVKIGNQDVTLRGKMLYKMEEGTQLYVVEMAASMRVDFGSRQSTHEQAGAAEEKEGG